MTIYANGHDGKLRAFGSEPELETYRQMLRDAEPAWLQRLRQHDREVQRLAGKASAALLERKGRTEALDDIAVCLRGLSRVIREDIDAAALEVAATMEPPA